MEVVLWDLTPLESRVSPFETWVWHDIVILLQISNNAMTTASAITVLNSIQENPDSALELLDMSVSDFMYILSQRANSIMNIFDLDFREVEEILIFFFWFQSMHIYKEALSLVKQILYSNPDFKFMYGGIVNSDDSIREL